MIVERPDLNGLRLVEPGGSEIWLVFHGRRHRVPNAVHAALFMDADFTVFGGVEQIERGPDLIESSILIRGGDPNGPFYLLTAAYEGGVRRHLIANHSVLAAFGFNPSKATELPEAVLGALPAGRDLIAG